MHGCFVSSKPIGPIKWIIVIVINEAICLEGLHGRLFLKLRRSPAGVSIVGRLTCVETPVTDAVVIDVVTCYKLRKLLRTTDFTRVDKFTIGLKWPVPRIERETNQLVLLLTVHVIGPLTCIAAYNVV